MKTEQGRPHIITKTEGELGPGPSLSIFCFFSSTLSSIKQQLSFGSVVPDQTGNNPQQNLATGKSEYFWSWEMEKLLSATALS